MTLNLINDGEPITYQKLNQMIQRINELDKTSDSEDQQEQIIVVNGSTIGNKDKVRVEVGSKKIIVPKGEEKEISLDFPVPFSNNPYVVCNVIDILPKQSGISFGAVTITEITKKAFSAKVKLFSEEKSVSVNVNYIALGTG